MQIHEKITKVLKLRRQLIQNNLGRGAADMDDYGLQDHLHCHRMRVHLRSQRLDILVFEVSLEDLVGGLKDTAVSNFGCRFDIFQFRGKGIYRCLAI